MRAPCLAAAPVSSVAICAATACAAPAVAKDGESTGALCHKHNLCSFLPVYPSLLVAGVLRLTLQVLRLIPTASQVAAMFLILMFNLQTYSPPAIQQFIFTSPSVDSCDRLSSFILMKLLPLRCCKLPPCHLLSAYVPLIPSVILPLYLCLYPPLLLLCHSPHFFSLCYPSHSVRLLVASLH